MSELSLSQEAVQRVAAGAPDGRQFDVVLLDMSMPLMGGVEATQARAALCTSVKMRVYIRYDIGLV